METIQQTALILASWIYFLLAGCHIILILFTDRLYPRSKQVIEAMQHDQMNLTRETTVWKAWVGFNISHSLGAIFIGLVNIIWALQFPSIILHSRTLLILNVITSVSYLITARKYWFGIPFAGIAVATVLFIVAAVISFL